MSGVGGVARQSLATGIHGDSRSGITCVPARYLDDALESSDGSKSKEVVAVRHAHLWWQETRRARHPRPRRSSVGRLKHVTDRGCASRLRAVRTPQFPALPKRTPGAHHLVSLPWPLNRSNEDKQPFQPSFASPVYLETEHISRFNSEQQSDVWQTLLTCTQPIHSAGPGPNDVMPKQCWITTA